MRFFFSLIPSTEEKRKKESHSATSGFTCLNQQSTGKQQSSLAD
jgi:hypothetical protein